MTTATEPRIPNPEPRAVQRLPAYLLKALFAEWAKFSPSLDWDCTEREARLRFANEVLGRGERSRFAGPPGGRRPPLQSWSELSQGEAKRLLREMKERSGSNAAYRALLIARLAAKLWGIGGQGSGAGDWQSILRERLTQRFRTPNPQSLSPSEAHAEIEELLSRLARVQGEGIETTRARFRRTRMADSEFPSVKAEGA